MFYFFGCGGVGVGMDVVLVFEITYLDPEVLVSCIIPFVH